MPQRHLPRNRCSNSTCSSDDDTAHAEEQSPNSEENIRHRLTSTSLSVASFDVISAGGCLNGGGGATEHFGTSMPQQVVSQQQQAQDNAFCAYFNELNCLPMDHWLRPSSTTANGSKKGIPLAASTPFPQHLSMSNNVVDMFSKIHLDSAEGQPQQRNHPFPSVPITSNVKNTQPRKRSVVADVSGDRLGDQQKGDAPNWARTDLSLWLNASSKGVPSSAVSSAAVINSVMGSAVDQWLLVKAPATANSPTEDNANSKVPLSVAASVPDSFAVPQPPDAKIRRYQMPFVMSKNAQQLVDVIPTKNSEPKTLAESKERSHFASLFNGDAIGGGAVDSAAVPTMADQPGHDTTPAALLSPLPMEEDSIKGDTAKEMAKAPKPPLALPTDPSHWLKRYPPPKQNRPMNEMAEDLYCWESVLGWKSILEKIHGSGEDGWLAPSSRAIKNA